MTVHYSSHTIRTPVSSLWDIADLPAISLGLAELHGLLSAPCLHKQQMYPCKATAALLRIAKARQHPTIVHVSHRQLPFLRSMLGISGKVAAGRNRRLVRTSACGHTPRLERPCTGFRRPVRGRAGAHLGLRGTASGSLGLNHMLPTLLITSGSLCGPALRRASIGSALLLQRHEPKGVQQLWRTACILELLLCPWASHCLPSFS